ncbi:MAG: hypothetical protein ACI9MR_002629 [Myxococcota bacterium]|jgi:uncharacterized protein (TIGR02231 family)
MRRSLLSLSLLALIPSLAQAAPETAEVPQNIVKTRVTAVTVYADRAQVTRTGSVTLSGKDDTFVIAGLPGWIDADSVRASLSPTGAGQLLDVSVEKTFLVAPSEAGVRDADAALIEISDQLAAISDTEQVVRQEIAQLEAVRAFSMDKLPRDMVTRPVKVRTFRETLDFVSEGLSASRTKLRGLSHQRRDLQPELQRRTKIRNEIRARAQLEQQQATVTVKGRGRATLKLTYLTPGATWEPMGELRVGGNRRDVTLSQVASVVQSTGEDWGDVALTFSTQRPGETLSVPEVSAMLLGGDGAGLGAAVNRASASFQRAQSTYSSQNMVVNRDRHRWADRIANQSQIQSRATTTFAKLAKRGTTAHFVAKERRTVRADGKAVRVPLSTGSFDATIRLVAVPEASLNVVQTAELINTGEQSILPGRATLFVDGAFVGTSEFPFVAPGETFSTFLGVHEGVKLERKIDRKRSKIERGKKRTEIRASFLVTATNLDKKPVTLAFGDRVPVAQDEGIDLDDVKIPKGAKRDRDGLVKWTAEIKPRTTRTWRIEYTLEYPNDMLDRQRANPAPASAPRKQRFYKQVQSLEEALH